MKPVSLQATVHQPQANTSSDKSLQNAAKELEAGFLTEMLKAAGLGKSRETMGGGAGEDQFTSLLVRSQAEQIVESGGIGLAESLFQALKDMNNGK